LVRSAQEKVDPFVQFDGIGKLVTLSLRRGAVVLVMVALLTRIAEAQPAEPLVPAPPAPPQPTAEAADVSALRAEVRALRAEAEEQRKQADKAASTPPAPPPPPPPVPAEPAPRKVKPLGYEELWPWILPPEGLSVSGYVQAQYETHQDSQDQLNANGTLLNKDRFSIRRARVTLTGEWEYAAIALQLDGNTTNGPQVDLRKAEASLQYRPDRSRPPMVMATLGLFDAPFGYENVEASHTRYFMEPSTASQAFFPGQADLGVRFAGALGFFRWTLAMQNGEPLGAASPYVGQDPVAGKDVIARFGFDAQPRTNVQVAGGVSGLTGEGFSPGTLASGSSLQWHDINGTGAVEASELVGVPAQSATASQTFNHWAVGADLRTSVRWWPGVAKLYGEVILAQNLDRALYVADPILTGLNQQEFGFYVAALQDVTRWGIVGIRYDYYNPNSNVFDKRGGSLIPYSPAIQTVSPLVGLVLPDHARLLLQYDIISNAYARNAVGVPTSLADNVLTLRLQVQL
jgi:phosphate-selective porin O/P